MTQKRTRTGEVRPGPDGGGISRGVQPGARPQAEGEPGERIGVILEAVGTVDEITAVRSDPHEPEWRRAMAAKSFVRRGADGAKKVSGEPREQAHGQERDGIQAENLARPPAGATASQSERDWAWCREALQRGLDPAIVRARLEERRADDQPNPEYYARRTVARASVSLRREMPAPEIER